MNFGLFDRVVLAASLAVSPGFGMTVILTIYGTRDLRQLTSSSSMVNRP
jgi:hypothetical protein